MFSCWQAFLRAQLREPSQRMPIPVSQPVPPDSTDPAMPAALAPAPATIIPAPPAIPVQPAPAVPAAPWPDYQFLAGIQAAGYQIATVGNQILLSPVAPSGYQRTPPPAPGSGFQEESPATRSWGWNQQGQWQGSQGNWQAQQPPEPPQHQNTWGPQSSTWGAQQGAGSRPALPAGWNHQQPSDRQRRNNRIPDDLVQVLSRFGEGIPAPATTNPVVVVNQGHQQGSTTGRRTRTPSPVNAGAAAAADDASKSGKEPSQDDPAAWWAYQVEGTGMRMM